MDALRSARYQLARVPQLIPVYSHRYLPGGRGTFGQPVLSLVQPNAADAILDYRTRTLPAARKNAQLMGRRGAQFRAETPRTVGRSREQRVIRNSRFE